jgi:hypothetical protein
MMKQACMLGIAWIGWLGCSEAAGDKASAAKTASTAAASGVGGSSSTVGSGGAPSIDGLVINEISAAGDDWVELYNTSSKALALAGLRLADDDAGMPKLAEAITFPVGAELKPGAYLFVLADLKGTAMTGEQSMCAPGPSPCFHAPWGISKSGDTIYLLNGTQISLSAEYPKSGVLDGQTWGRLPNGTGSFAAVKPTPGAANVAP